MFNTALVITYQPNQTGLPPDVNPAWLPLQEARRTKITEMQATNLLGNLMVANNVTTMNFVSSAAALEFQNFLTETLIDFDQVVPTFEIIQNS
jgi:hypothetical protein